MQDTSRVRSTDKTDVTTKVATQSEFVELKDKTIEEKKLKLALDLHKF